MRSTDDRDNLELHYDCRTPEHHRLIKLAYDAGIGELNTTGFGFINDLN
ncbi:CRISPR-associated endoribonuclease Cas6 [Halocatena halophila]